jgi:excisionase family DNA binding protein
MLHVSKPTVWRWIESGRLPAARVGPRLIRIRRVDLRQLDQPVCARRPMTREELRGYILPRPAPTRSEEESMALIEEINKRIRARNGGKPLGSSVPLIHEQRR